MVWRYHIAIGGTLYLLDQAWGFGTETLPASQANIMKLIVEGVSEGNLPWELVFIGVFIAVVVEIIGIPVLPFAIGVYLPIHLSSCIMTGGIVRLIFDKIRNKEKRERAVSNGILFSSGMIAGEGITGLVLAILTICGVNGHFDLSGFIELPIAAGKLLSVTAFAVIIFLMIFFSLKEKRNEKQ